MLKELIELKYLFLLYILIVSLSENGRYFWENMFKNNQFGNN